jgi:competence protein ComEC
VTPLIELTALFIGADLVGLRLSSTLFAGASLLGAAVLLAPALLAASPLSRRSVRLTFMLLGVAVGSATGRSIGLDCRRDIPDGVTIVATGLLEAGATPGSRAVLHPERITAGGHRSPCTRAIRVRLPDEFDGALAGWHVRVSGNWWRVPASPGWPQPADRAGTLSVRTIVASDSRERHAHLLNGIRRRAFQRVRDRFPRESGMAESLLLARRDGLAAGVRDDFAAAGLAHLLAISGAHVGVLAGMVMLLSSVLGLTPRRGAIAATLAAAAYVCLLGAPPAAARAAIQSVAVLTARLAQRPADRLTLLAGAALLLVAVDPSAPLGAGFQLSFAGVYGLLAFGPPLRRLMPDAVPRPLAGMLAPTIAATAATAPIAAWHFGLVSFIGPASNLIAAPLMALAIPAMTAALLAAVASEALAGFVAGGAEAVLALLRRVAGMAAAVPAGHAWVSADAVTAAVLAGAGFILCGGAVRRRFTMAGPGGAAPVRRARLLARGGVATAILVVWPVLRPGGSLEIHAIDVGQGDAIAIRTPAGRWFVIDAGPATTTFDAGRQRIAPYLRARGARAIDLLVLTHPDMDHIGGARALFEAFDVGLVMDPAMATGKDLYLETLEAARVGGGTWLRAEAGREIEAGAVRLRVLAPDSALLDGLYEANDVSVVLRLEYGAFSALFFGDAPIAIENRLVARHGTAMGSDLLKVGHHGSRTSTGDSLLMAVRPHLALISVGRRNRYGHPDPGVLDRLARYGVRVARTDENGSIILTVRPDGSTRLLSAR